MLRIRIHLKTTDFNLNILSFSFPLFCLPISHNITSSTSSSLKLLSLVARPSKNRTHKHARKQVMWLTFCTAVVGSMAEGDLKRRMVDLILIHCFGLLSSALSAVITYHNEENKPKSGICAANHTSPIDALVLMCDNCYSLVSGFGGPRIRLKNVYT